MEKLKETISLPKARRYTYLLCGVFLLCLVIFRFSAIGAEKSLNVFNAARMAADVGAPVEIIEVSKTEDIIKEPIGIENNRAYVSAARVGKLHRGQKVGEGEIISVSSNIDLDTGMYVIKTRGVSDGLQYAEFVGTGYFVPAYAVNNNSVLVFEDGFAVSRDVIVIRQDSENAFILEGLNDGDKVILSKVNAGDKVQVKNN